MKWEIKVYPNPALPKAYDIETRFGQEGGKIQETSDTIFEGKNLGKKNETSAWEQACLEAEAKWSIQQRIQGYVSDVSRAMAKENDRQGYEPMLAKSFDDHKSKIKYPAAIQPKLDGMRAPAIITDSTALLFSRNGKPISAVPHIQKELLEAFPAGSMPDGELYNHDYKDQFEDLMSIVRKEKDFDKDCVMQYHIYDIAGTEDEFLVRSANLRTILLNEDGTQKYKYLKYVPTNLVDSEAEALQNCIDFQTLGYEGAMLRGIASVYEEGKRSFQLQKMKTFIDSEFEIVGIEEGRGKLIGHVGAFKLKTFAGKDFKAKLEGSQERLKELFENEKLWKNKTMTVKYQNLTKDGIPRFPVGKSIRDYE